MDTIVYISLFSLYVLCGFLIYKNRQLERKLKDQDEKQKKALTAAGGAITDTLRVAFENIKRHGSEMNKLSGKHTEHQSRLHRLEQTTQQMLAKNSKNISTEQKEEIKNEKRNSKTS